MTLRGRTFKVITQLVSPRPQFISPLLILRLFSAGRVGAQSERDLAKRRIFPLQDSLPGERQKEGAFLTQANLRLNLDAN